MNEAEYTKNYEGLSVEEKIEFYKAHPAKFKQINSGVMNEYYILTRPQKSKNLYTAKTQQILAGLPETEIHKALNIAPKETIEFLGYRQVFEMADRFETLSGTEHKQLEILYNRLTTNHTQLVVDRCIAQQKLFPLPVPLNNTQKTQYLPLVVSSGEQLGHYFEHYAQRLTECYANSEHQHVETQKFMVSQKPELIFSTNISAANKIGYLSSRPEAIKYFVKFQNLEAEVENFCIDYQVRVMERLMPELKDNHQKYRMALGLKEMLRPRTIEFLEHQGKLDWVLKLKLCDINSNRLNLAQFLWADYSQFDSLLLKRAEMLQEPIVFQSQFLVKDISMSEYLWAQNSFSKILELPSAETNFYVAAALKQKTPAEHLRVEHLGALEKIDFSLGDLKEHQITQINALMERLRLQRDISPEGMQNQNTFKI